MTERVLEQRKPPSGADCEIRPASSLNEALEIWWPLMQHLGWNRSPFDLATYIAMSSSRGLLLAVPNSVNVPKGHVMATINDNLTAWVTVLALYPEFQGLGYGRALLTAAIKEMADCRAIHVGLDSVAEQKDTYQRRGFVESPIGVIQCMSRQLLASEPLHTPYLSTHHLRVVNIKDIACPLLVQSDLDHTGFQREGLWTSAFFERADVFGFAVIKKEEINDEKDITAWAVVRRCPSGFRLGPVYADDEVSAKAVMIAALEDATPEAIHRVPIDGDLSKDSTAVPSVVAEVWDGNPAAMSAFEELGWKSAGVTYNRMWLNNKPTRAQDEGGLAHTGMFAVFDAAVG